MSAIGSSKSLKGEGADLAAKQKLASRLVGSENGENIATAKGSTKSFTPASSSSSSACSSSSKNKAADSTKSTDAGANNNKLGVKNGSEFKFDLEDARDGADSDASTVETGSPRAQKEEENDEEQTDITYKVEINGATQANTATTEEETVYTIETGDSIKVRQVLDTSILDCLSEQCGYEVDYTAENWKLVLMLLACGFALCAQFYPEPFPKSRPVLGICCAGYFAISGLLQYIISFVDKDKIITTIAKKAEGGKEAKGAIEIHTSFPRFQEWYIMIIHKVGETGGCEATNPNNCVAKMYVGTYFTALGEYDEKRFLADVAEHLKRFEQGKTGQFEYNHKSKKD